MGDKELEGHKRRLEILREQAAKYGLDCPPHILIEIRDLEELLKKYRDCIDETLSPDTIGKTLVYIKSGITKVAIISAVTATLTTFFVIWSYTRPLSLELVIARLAVGLVIGMLMYTVIEAATKALQTK